MQLPGLSPQGDGTDRVLEQTAGDALGQGAVPASALSKPGMCDFMANAVLLEKTVFTLWLMSFDLCEFGLIIILLGLPFSQSDQYCDLSHSNNS